MVEQTRKLEETEIEELSDRFWRNGFIVIEDFFEDELMDAYDDLICQHFGEDPAFEHNSEFLSKAATEVVPWFPQREGVSAFDAVEKNEDLNRLTSHVLGEGWYADYCMVMFSKQGTKGQAWHQDCEPEDPAKFNLNRLIYTADITDEIGGLTMVVPGSHRRGLLPSESKAKDFPDRVVLRPKKGTVVLLHGHTWHSVSPVVGRYRSSTNYRSATKASPEGITDICVYQNMRYQFSTSSVVEVRD